MPMYKEKFKLRCLTEEDVMNLRSEIAVNMLEKNKYTAEEIVEITGIDIDGLKELKEQM